MRVSDPYIASVGFLNRLPAATKLTSAILIVITTVALSRDYWFGYAMILAFLLAVLAVSRLPVWIVVRRVLMLEPFVLLTAALSLFQPDGGAVFASLILKGSISLFSMVMLTASTRFLDVLAVLRRMRIPGALITNIALMYRYLFLLFVESERMSRARSSRDFVHKRRRIWRANAIIIGHLFVRTSARAERIFAAMCARGWKA